MNGIRGSIINIYNLISFYKDKLEKQTVFIIVNKDKTMLVITLYRILSSINGGMSTSLVQYNMVEAKVRAASYYQKQIFTEIVQYIQKQEFNDILITRDLN